MSEQQPQQTQQPTEENKAVVAEETTTTTEASPSSLGEIVSDSTKGQFDDVIEKPVAQWMKDQLNKEKRRISNMGSKSIAVDVKNAGIIKEEDGKIINRMELNSNFDFDKVNQIMISESTECPIKKGYNYINVLLFANNPVPLIVPYIYLKSIENNLTEWLFINNQFSRSRHTIKEYKDM